MEVSSEPDPSSLEENLMEELYFERQLTLDW